MFDPEVYHKALKFAAKAHCKQHMPGQELPYLLHLTQVCGEIIHALAQDASGMNPDFLISVALLHDTIEDTDVTHQELTETFGVAIANGVMALSKNKELLKPDQMPDSLRRIMEQPAELRMVKMADRIVNLQEPPYFWKNAKRLKYQEEARTILDKLQGVHPYIESRLEAKIEAYSQYIS